jgi:L-ribulose-5-phosphate 3-epimerase
MARASDRRRFLESTAAWAALVALRPGFAFAANLPRKAITFSALPPRGTLVDRFQFAADCGFSGVEMAEVADPAAIERIREAAARAGVCVHSVVAAGMDGATAALRNAHAWGARVVVIERAASSSGTSYQDAWNRSQAAIRERILPLARELNVVLAIERVWDGFVLGPHEVARYVDALASPLVGASFDMSRTVFYAGPQDWIRTLDSRLVNVRGSAGALASAESRDALHEIAYAGLLTTGLTGAASWPRS